MSRRTSQTVVTINPEDENQFTGGRLRGGGEKAQTLAALACALVCISILVLGLAAPTLYYAFEEENATCQKGTRAGLTLSDWLKGAGFADVISLFIIWVLVLGLAAYDTDPSGALMVYTIVSIIFKFIWWIIGIVVVSTNENNKCVGEGNALGVMTIINLVLFWLSSSAGRGGSGGD